VALLVGERRTEEVASAIPTRGLLADALKQARVKPMGNEPSAARKQTIFVNAPPAKPPHGNPPIFLFKIPLPSGLLLFLERLVLVTQMVRPHKQQVWTLSQRSCRRKASRGSKRAQ
jgi:hypothetical protein